MQAYRHPSKADMVVLSIEGSPMMRAILEESEFADEMQYDESTQWFAMHLETYKRLRAHLPRLSVLGKRPRTDAKMSPKEVAGPLTRTVNTQTERPVARTHETQTDDEVVDVSSPAPPSVEPPASVVVPEEVPQRIPPPPPPIPFGGAPMVEEEETTRNPAPLPPPSHDGGQTLCSGYSNLRDVVLRRLLVGNMLRD